MFVICYKAQKIFKKIAHKNQPFLLLFPFAFILFSAVVIKNELIFFKSTLMKADHSVIMEF